MDKKNTLLLTVIAIATLLVAVVGATFAYFTAQAGEAKNATVDVKTSTVDTLTFDTKPIYLLATQQNFANVNGENVDEHAGSQRAISTSTVDYKKGGEGSKDYCYEVTLNITSNNFTYAPSTMRKELFASDDDGSSQETKFKSQHAPELLLKITKKTEKKAKAAEEFSSEGSPIIYGSSSNEPLKKLNGGTDCAKTDETVKAECVYYEHLESQRKVCTQNNEEAPTGNNIQYAEGKCSENEMLEGFDVTILNNSSAEGTNKEFSQIGIPAEDGGSDYKHKLTGTNEGDEVKDTWTAELVFVNYDWDQQYNASPNSGTPKNFNATFNFKAVECGE